VALNDRENILSAFREKPLEVREVMNRGNVVNEEAFSHVKDGETKSLPARSINGFHVTQAIRVASTRRVASFEGWRAFR